MLRPKSCPCLSRCLLIGLFLSQSASLHSAEKLNIILIMADDSAVDNYSCYGSDFFSSPRIDSLAETGARFNYCYSEPVCTSSRVKIMTGDGVRNYVNFGILDKGETTFADMLKSAGYATAVAGKWQLHAEPMDHSRKTADSIATVSGIFQARRSTAIGIRASIRTVRFSRQPKRITGLISCPIS